MSERKDLTKTQQAILYGRKFLTESQWKLLEKYAKNLMNQCKTYYDEEQCTWVESFYKFYLKKRKLSVEIIDNLLPLIETTIEDNEDMKRYTEASAWQGIYDNLLDIRENLKHRKVY